VVVLELKKGASVAWKQQTFFDLKNEMGKWGMSFTAVTSAG
jgi:hypothetical protein